MAVDLQVNDKETVQRTWEQRRNEYLCMTLDEVKEVYQDVTYMQAGKIPRNEQLIDDFNTFFKNGRAVLKVGTKPIRNCSDDKNCYPLDQSEYRGWAYNQRNGSLIQWFKLPAPERVTGGLVWVGFRMGDELRWEKKADVIANRFLYKNPGDVVKFKDGNSNNCKLQNLEWSEPWTAGNSNSKSGVKGIIAFLKPLASGKSEMRYKTKINNVIKTFKTLEEAKQHLGIPATEEKDVFVEKIEQTGVTESDGED